VRQKPKQSTFLLPTIQFGIKRIPLPNPPRNGEGTGKVNSSLASSATTAVIAARTARAISASVSAASVATAISTAVSAPVASAISPVAGRAFGPLGSFGAFRGRQLVGQAKLLQRPSPAELDAVVIVDVDDQDLHLVADAANVADAGDVARRQLRNVTQAVATG
jgi:hypothetical protein